MNKGKLITSMQLVGVGWYVAASIIFGLLGGLWIDGKLGTLPVFTLLGVILGTVAAFYGVYKMMVPLLKQDKG